MTLARWAPERTRSFERFNKMMEDVFGMDEFRGVWSPHVDIKENDKEFVFLCELPGLNEQNFSVELNGEVLTIKGERTMSNEEKKEDYVCIERNYGTFSRSFTLGVPVKSEAINASFSHGLLKVIVPKSEATLPKKISIKTS